jgi:alkylation response protein AidB-like acyl-CoA dehydrogenase
MRSGFVKHRIRASFQRILYERLRHLPSDGGWEEAVQQLCAKASDEEVSMKLVELRVLAKACAEELKNQGAVWLGVVARLDELERCWHFGGTPLCGACGLTLPIYDGVPSNFCPHCGEENRRATGRACPPSLDASDVVAR